MAKDDKSNLPKRSLEPVEKVDQEPESKKPKALPKKNLKRPMQELGKIPPPPIKKK